MFARTKRLLLRPGWAEDAGALAQAIGDLAVARNLARVPHPYGVDDARGFLESPHDPLLPRFLAFARTCGAPRLIGGCGISRSETGALELGYWIARPYWGLGFATEAGRAVMRVARATGLKDIGAHHMIDNPASGNVLRKLGFRFTGQVQRRHSIGRGADVDCLIFEQGEEGPMARDSAPELYLDALPPQALAA
ncbi:GNAT family N-acetyltransferase [Sphingobium aquiterrae]|uniref:GNAT family N-acetyltransferase n=1 Tax=Sphingobium aquiterrae TaxID=2038656 RepID=UPI00301A3764